MALSIFSVILAITACDHFRNTVTVTNGTGSPISHVTVSVCDSSWTIAELVPGESREFTVIYTHDDDFLVETPNTSERFGYVTHGMIEDRVVITLQEDSIQFLQTTKDY